MAEITNSNNERSPKKNFIDFPALIKESVGFMKRHKKIVLILALIITLTGGYINSSSGFSSGNINFNNSSSTSTSTPYSSKPSSRLDQNTGYEELDQVLDQTVRATEDFIRSGYFIAVLITACSFGLIWIIISVYLNTISNSALINFTYSADQGKVKSFKEVWSEGREIFWKVLLMRVLYIVLAIIVGVLSIFLMCFICVGWILLILLGFAWSFIMVMSTRYVIIQKMEPLDAVMKAYEDLKQNYMTVIYYSLYSLLIGLIVAIISLIIIGSIGGVALLFSVLLQSFWIMIPAIIILIPVTVALGAVVNAFMSIFDTKMFEKFTE